MKGLSFQSITRSDWESALNNLIKLTLKMTFSVAIIAWLLKSGKLDFSLINRSLSSGYQWLICFLLLVIQAIGASLRWRWLLGINSSRPISVPKTIKVTWIGLFFNSFLPGAVTGDLIKLVYAKDLDPEMSKTYLVTTVLVDRILGLIGLLCILGISSLYYYSEIISLSAQMSNLIHFNIFLFAGAISFIIFLFIPRGFQEKLLLLADIIPFIGEKIRKTLTSFWTIGDHKGVLFKCIIFSIGLQALSFYAFYLVSSPFYSQPIPYQYIVTFIPLGFMATAIPIAPAGLGIGHAAFDKLFSLAGISGGASFFNLFFLILITVNFLGLIPYLFSKKKTQIKKRPSKRAFSKK